MKQRRIQRSKPSPKGRLRSPMPPPGYTMTSSKPARLRRELQEITEEIEEALMPPDKEISDPDQLDDVTLDPDDSDEATAEAGLSDDPNWQASRRDREAEMEA